MSVPSPSENEIERVAHYRDQVVQRAELDLEAMEDDATDALERHPRLFALGHVVRGVVREQSEERVSLAASGAAFWLVISFLPTAVAIVSLFGMFVSPERVVTDLGRLANDVPGSLGSLFSDQLQHLAATKHAGLSVGFVVSLVAAVWSASAGFNNLDGAIRVAYGVPPETYLQARGRAFVGALCVVVVLGSAAVASPVALARSSVLLIVLGVPVVLAVIVAGVAALYRFSVGPQLRHRAVLPGAAASALGLVVVILTFGSYVAHSSRYTAVYGAFGGAVIGMLGIYLAVYVVLLGAVLNVQLGGKVPATEPE